MYNSTYKRIYSDRSLSACDTLTLLLIHRLCGNRDYIYANLTQLSKELSYDISTISRSLIKLEEKNYITRDKKVDIIYVKEKQNGSEGYVNLSTQFFDKILDKKDDFLKKHSNATRVALKLYHNLNIKIKDRYVGKVERQGFIKSFSKDFHCSEKTVRRVLRILLDGKLFKNMSDSLYLIKIASQKLFEPAKRLYGRNRDKKRDRNYYRDRFLLTSVLNPDTYTEKDITDTSELITQYRDKFMDGEKVIVKIIKDYAEDNGFLFPADIHHRIRERIKNPAIAYVI